MTAERRCSPLWSINGSLLLVLVLVLRLTGGESLNPVQLANASGAAGARLHSLTPGEFVPNDPSATPTFILIGVPKGGTTDLHAQLVDDVVNRSPERNEPPLTWREKEITMLHSEQLRVLDLNTPYSRPFKEYLAKLSHPCANVSTATQLRECLANPNPSSYTFDASPGYYFWTHVPPLLRSFTPNSKVVLMLREPLDRAQSMYFMWQVLRGKFGNASFDDLTSDFFRTFETSGGDAAAILQRLASCPAAPKPVRLKCQADGWADLAGSRLLWRHDFQLFLPGLYQYSLAAWRLHYFQPGRVLVIDSHAYFQNRVGVMEQVIAFLYGRPMNSAERQAAQRLPPKNVRDRHKSHLQAATRHIKWHLSPANQAKLQQLYDTHVLQGLRNTLDELREEGAWVVGFGAKPWPWASP